MPDVLGAAAPAKINLILEVLARRSDGYHELSTVMQKVALADSVTLSWEREPGVTVTGAKAGETPADAANLAWQAAVALADRVRTATPMPHILIDKQIPPASGLGGGASDAATALRLLAVAWSIDDEALLRGAANAVGSDEAFFLGGPTAIVTGRGDVVSPLPDLPPHGVVLFIPHASLDAKTATLFRALSATPFDSGEWTKRFLAAHPAPCTVEDTQNAFERVAFDTFPGLGTLRDQIEAAIGSPIRLAGAGPTLYWIGRPDKAAQVAIGAAGIDGVDVVPTVTLQ